MTDIHCPVLLDPTVDALMAVDADRPDAPAGAAGALDPHGVYVDGTFGRGGHSRLLLSKLSPQARLVVFDKDPQAIAQARQLQQQDDRLVVVHDGFAAMAAHLQDMGVGQVQGVMLDLGISSPQIDVAERGFSFMRDGPLDMRMDTSQGLTAAQWLEQADVDHIKEVIADYGEERFAFQIAKAIAARRESRPLHTTRELAELVAGVVRTREKGQHPATRTFQALRIHINQELEELKGALAAALNLLAPGGRLAVISFHSLEDRIVKQTIAAAARPAAALARLPIPEKDMPQPVVRSVGRILPTDTEVADNPRARSAVLRVAQRTVTPLPPEGGAAFVPGMARADADDRRRQGGRHAGGRRAASGRGR